MAGPVSGRIAANTANAHPSTGPRTDSGRARIGRNAVLHGLYAASLRRSQQEDGSKFAEKARSKLMVQCLKNFQPEPRPETLMMDEFVDLTERMKQASEDQISHEGELRGNLEVDAATLEKASDILDTIEHRLRIRRSRAMRTHAFLDQFHSQRGQFSEVGNSSAKVTVRDEAIGEAPTRTARETTPAGIEDADLQRPFFSYPKYSNLRPPCEPAGINPYALFIHINWLTVNIQNEANAR